ncbi:MAG: geranylgeranylglycerol-phosphate geranylgeranyltransferase [Candidatus Eisenbacteria bacterium]
MISLRACRHVLVLLRLHNCVIAWGSVALGSFLAGGTIGYESMTASLMAFFVCAGGYALNDIFDVETDRVIKPWRPLVGNRLRRETAVTVVIAVWAIGCGFALLSGRSAVGFFLGWAVLLYLYSWKIKSYGVAGPIVVSFFASSGFLLGGLTGGSLGAAVFPFVIAMSLHMARETVKSVADIRGDSKAGISTVAVRLGARKTLGLSLGCIAAVIITSLLPFVLRVYGYLYLLPVVMVVYPLLAVCIYLITRARIDLNRAERNSGSVTTLLKVAMPIGLAALLLAGI